MRWHVAAVAAVWLVLIGWFGSVVTGQPVTGMQERQSRADGQQQLSIGDVWAVDPTNDDSASQDEEFHQQLYYFPNNVPIKRQTADDADSGWFVQSQDRSKRQSHTNSGSSSNHHSQLSIISPIEALRSRLRLEMLRRQWGNQIKQNQDKLERLGKRRKRNDSISNKSGTSSNSHATDPSAEQHGSDGKRMSQPALASAIKEP